MCKSCVCHRYFACYSIFLYVTAQTISRLFSCILSPLLFLSACSNCKKNKAASASSRQRQWEMGNNERSRPDSQLAKHCRWNCISPQGLTLSSVAPESHLCTCRLGFIQALTSHQPCSFLNTLKHCKLISIFNTTPKRLCDCYEDGTGLPCPPCVGTGFV